jgi:UPF0042 nucleotide-binding protein
MELVIVTGMSGAGKSTAVNALEDIGFYCVDNVPPKIIPSFIDLSNLKNELLNRLAIVTDSRGGELFSDITEVLNTLDKEGMNYRIIFFDTSNDEIIRRYKENRRSHPLLREATFSLESAIAKERQMLSSIKSRADFVIDTTYMGSAQLKQKLASIFLSSDETGLSVQVMSFGFKYGFASEADLVFDVRCLPNPFYEQSLKNKTGLEQEVKDFVLSSDEAKEFYKKIVDFLMFSLPLYKKEGKSNIVIAFGCTGGKHRSVTFAELVGKTIKEKGFNTHINHKDIEKKNR